MLLSLAFIFLCGMLIAAICKKIKLPALLGMLITGIVLGPYVLNLLDSSILAISADLRKIALILILARAGLSLDINDLIKAGRPAVLMCFVPACFEIAGMIILAPIILGVTILEAAIMGTVVAAVSPAVVVPKMLFLMENKYGTNKSIPQLIMAGASVDDIFVIVLFTVFIGLEQGKHFSAVSLFQVPVSILLGAVSGIILGVLFAWVFKKYHMRDSVKVVLLLSLAFLLVTLENTLSDTVPFSGLLAIMSMGIALQKKHSEAAKRLSKKFSKLWVGAEILLFVLVGAAVDIRYAFSYGVSALLLILGVLVFRMLGVFVSMIKTNLTWKERTFCMLAYLPKATVQAAIGSIPLSLGLSCGNIVLTVAVLSILITAPLGAFSIDVTFQKLLQHEN